MYSLDYLGSGNNIWIVIDEILCNSRVSFTWRAMQWGQTILGIKNDIRSCLIWKKNRNLKQCRWCKLVSLPGLVCLVLLQLEEGRWPYFRDQTLTQHATELWHKSAGEKKSIIEPWFSSHTESRQSLLPVVIDAWNPMSVGRSHRKLSASDGDEGW